MKKIISLLITTLLLLSFIPATFAAEITTQNAIAPTFGVYNDKYPGKTVGEEYIVYKNSSSSGVPSLAVNFPSTVKSTNAATNYPSAKWYKMDFDLNMKVDHKFSFLFRYSFTSSTAYIPNYCESTGVLKKSSNVPVKAGEKLHISILFDLKDNIGYFFINNLLVTFKQFPTSDIGNLMYINMSSAPTTATLASGETLDIFSVTNATGKLYDSNTTIEDMGLYNWMYSEAQTEDGYSYNVVASWEGYAAFNGTNALGSGNIGAYVAGFDNEGKLVTISPFQNLNGTTKDLTLTSNAKADEIKVFVWDRNVTTGKSSLIPTIPSITAMKVQNLKPVTPGFAVPVN